MGSFGRYIVSMAVADASDQIWLSGFNDVGTALFGISGNELHGLRVRFIPLQHLGKLLTFP